jgi:multicomponent Na+:H+ antiporter subunit D
MPITMLAFSIGALSMIGIPPAVGFISKWYMIGGAFSRELYWIIGVIIISTLLNCAYFLPVIYKAFFKEEKMAPGVVITNNHGESSFPIVIAMFITAIATIGLFIYPGVFMELAKAVVN